MVKKQLNSEQLKIQDALDEDKKTSKSYFKFKKSIKQSTTLRAYNHALDRFMIFSNYKSYDDVVKLETEQIQELLESYVISINNLSYQSVNQRLAGVELFFDMNMKLYHKKVLRKLLPSNEKEQGGKLPFTTDEIHRMLSVTTKFRSKALIHYFASTGTRPASIEDPILRMKHIEDMPHNCKAIKIYDGSKSGYWVFLTPEASSALTRYFNQRKLNGEILTDESPVFANVAGFPTTVKEHMAQNGARQAIRDILNKAGIERTKSGQRFDKAELYGFRKRFNTILKLNNDVNSNIAEKLMAHKRGLDGTYLQPTRDECFREFVKAIPELTVDPTERQKYEIQKLEGEKSELQRKIEENEMQWDEIERLRQSVNVLMQERGEKTLSN